MSSERVQKIFVCACAAVIASLVGIFMVASAQNNSVSVCVSSKNSSLRYTKDKVCKAGSETLLTLNEVGPVGATGVTGAAGAAGAAGPAGAFPTTYSIGEITISHTLQASDAGKLLISRDGTTITLPTNASVPIPVGTRIDVANRRSFLTVSPAAGVTINFVAASVSFDTGNFQMGVLIKLTADEWVFMSSPNEFE
jgi:hypothetical protein